ncbi:RNA polymerase sigma factor [Egicoccus sp. AB-alg2]|uniref:RNA polymerase sigma factor n=1 Tax=Egicoccus sp. AB-alg2 TaxID=3242693 RepID=UPI00359D2807
MPPGDEDAFRQVFETHRHALHGFLLGRTSDPEMARDLLQETFLRLWHRFDEVGDLEEDRLRGWLITVARNLVVDGYRAAATRRATVTALGRQPAPAAEDLADRASRRDEVARVHQAIATLPDEQRQILTMATVGSMTSQQIGEALDLPAGTVRYKLHQARERLALNLED